MKFLKHNKKYTVIGVISAFFIAILLSTSFATDTNLTINEGIANLAILAITIRAIVVVLAVWLFFENALVLIDRWLNNTSVSERYRNKKMNIITWYLMFETIMLITFI